MISTEPPYLTSQRFLEEIQLLFYEPFFQKHRKERWKTSTTPLATRWSALIETDRGQLDLVECFVVDFPPKVTRAGVARLPVTTPHSKCGHFSWFTWWSKMNGKVEDLTWRFVILYGFPEPVRFQSTYFSNCILSFTNSVNAQTSCSWYMWSWRHLFICVSTGFNLFIAVTWIVVLTYEIL